MFDITVLNASVRDPAGLGAFAKAFHDQDLPFGVVMHDEASGQVLMSMEGGGFERAPIAVWATVTGEELRDPGKLNPIASSSIRRNSKRMAAHAAETRSLMLVLVRYLDPALGKHPWIEELIDEALTRMQEPVVRRGAVKLASNYDRWDLLLNSFVPLARDLCARRANG